MGAGAGPTAEAREVLTRALADAKEAAHSVRPAPHTLSIVIAASCEHTLSS